MQKRLLFALFIALIAAIPAFSQDKAFTVDFSGWNAPGLEAYQANEKTFAVTLQNAGAAYNFSGYTPMMWWAVSNSSVSTVTASVHTVNATAGTFRATFYPTDLNTYGTFIYGVSITSNNVSTARQGQFVIRRDPYAVGGTPVQYGTNMNFGLISRYFGVLTRGPYRAGANISASTNSDGSVTFSAADVTGITAATATNIVQGLAYPLTSNPSNYCTLAQAAESLWIAASNTVVYTNDFRLTDNRTDGAAWHYGDTVTNAVDSVARGLTNYDAYGSALAVSNAFTNAAALAVGAVQTNSAEYQNLLTNTATAAQGELADTALQVESDTLQSVTARGSSSSNTIMILQNDTGDAAVGDVAVILEPLNYASASPLMEFRNGSAGLANATNFLGMVGIGVNKGSFKRFLDAYGTTGYMIHDAGNFLSGADYLSPSGSGTNLTGITAEQVGALSTNGGALNGAVTTIRSNGWAGNELITADGVRGFLSSGKALYMTTNVFAASWQPTNATTIGAYEPTAYSTRFSVGISSANQYIATMVDTNPIPAGTEMVGPATVVINIHTPSGGGTSLSVKPEIYYTYDLNATSLTLGDFDAAAQAITVGATNAYTWSIAFATVVPTSTFYRVYRLKTTAKGSSTTTASIGMGGSIDSYVLYQQGADTLGARGATNIVTGAANGYDSTTRTLTYAGLTNISTAAIVEAGAITNSLSDPYMTPTNLLGLISGTTATWTRAWGNAGYLEPTGTVYFAADATMTDTNGLVGFSLDLFYNGQTFGFVGASVTNTATLTSNAWNSIIFWKGRGSSVFVGK